MRIAIHKRTGGFSEAWIQYCISKKIPFKVVDCYEDDILSKLKDCDALMWHHHHNDYKDMHLARPLLFSLQVAGVTVFPDFYTNWHFDNKLAQKYSLEAVDAPLVNSYVFYDKRSAIKWAQGTKYPKVFKLKNGAGATNVKLVKSFKESKKLVNKSFGRGWPVFNRVNYFKERLSKLLEGRETLLSFFRSIMRLLVPPPGIKYLPRESGYAYFQDFVAGNDSDTRVVVVSGKAFAIKRLVRKGDFRASGSGNIIHDKESIDERCVKVALETSIKLNAQCLAYDFVFDESGAPLIIEISYGFSMAGYIDCPGYWDKNLKWIEGKFDPYGWMVEVVKSRANDKFSGPANY